MAAATLRCAIYTRKSSEEGLDQSFNSLDAQREACEAYVLSQTCEGWTALTARYDDGGFSGGSMERPGLRRLLADIEAGLVDVVVVYKIDRLTRSLADFARIVEIFEKADCSFVSVTQSFNTTGSMGKLMLNVLLSFAQFEREVTGERIRDKIAASKARGMWMGGVPPIGYDMPGDGSRTLKVNEDEAATVRTMFERYLDLGSVRALQRELVDRGILSKRWTTAKGQSMGGQPFSSGALFQLLRRRVYLGQIVHKDQVHDGSHEAIIDQALFDRVQARLDAQARRHRASGERRVIMAPLTGKLFDVYGEPMSPTTSRGKSGRSYRYYVSTSLQKGGQPEAHSVQRLSAPDIERVVGDAAARWLGGPSDPFAPITSVHIVSGGLQVALAGADTRHLLSRISGGEIIVDRGEDSTTILLLLAMPVRGGRRMVEPAARRHASPDPALIAALRRAHSMLQRERGLPTLTASPVSPYERMILRLALLAPDIQQAILRGRQPPGFNLEKFKAMDIPLAWSQQREVLGFGELSGP